MDLYNKGENKIYFVCIDSKIRKGKIKMNTSYYTQEELEELGFKSIGKQVLISKKASIYSNENISIGSNVRIDDFCILSGNITLGNHIHIAAYAALFSGRYEILVKDFAAISARSIVYAESDDYVEASMAGPVISKEFRFTKGKNIVLEKHALVGANCTILPGVTIGEGASIGAMSLINHNLEPWYVYAGIPARKLRERNKDILKLEKEYLKKYTSKEDC